MTCLQLPGGVTVCRPSDDSLRRRILRCPTCQCKREMVAQFDVWHSTIFMCTGCGDSWQDGELCYRPFARGWRKRSAAQFRALWDIATYGPPPPLEELLDGAA